MRIALVTHFFPAHRGGVELVAGALARELATHHGADIEWHASDTDPPPRISGVRCVPAKACNAIERRFGVPYPLWSPDALLRTARSARRAEALHVHDCLYLPNLVAYVAARLAGRHVLVTQHVGMVPYRSFFLRAALSFANRIFGRIVLGGATQVVFVSHSVRRYFADFVRFRAPPLVVANGVDTALFRPADETRRAELRAQLSVPEGEPLFLFVGRFVEKKGLAVLRELATRLAGVRWVFAGWGPLDPEHWSAPNVTVLRGRWGDGLVPLYQAADLLVLPSVGEGFPLVVQEAMACGTPALVGSETAEAWPDAAQLLLAEATAGTDVVSRWELRLRELASQPARLAALRGEVAAYAAANWSWQRCAARYAEILRECGRK